MRTHLIFCADPGPDRRAYINETFEGYSFANAVRDIWNGEYANPVKVVWFDGAFSGDVSTLVAEELAERARHEQAPACVLKYCLRYGIECVEAPVWFRRERVLNMSAGRD